MAYKYITNNNLYKKQTYMYSEYKGMDFLNEYLENRYSYLESWKNEKTDMISHDALVDNPTKVALRKIYNKLEKEEFDKETIDSVNKYVKSFEVRKRIYTDYDDNWRPLAEAEFEDYENYLLFADCLLCVYQHTKCMKYLSCLLKLDDTLLSIYNCLYFEFREWLSRIVRQELEVFQQLVKVFDID